MGAITPGPRLKGAPRFLRFSWCFRFFLSSTDIQRFTAFLNLFSEFWLVGPYGDQWAPFSYDFAPGSNL